MIEKQKSAYREIEDELGIKNLYENSVIKRTNDELIDHLINIVDAREELEWMYQNLYESDEWDIFEKDLDRLVSISFRAFFEDSGEWLNMYNEIYDNNFYTIEEELSEQTNGLSNNIDLSRLEKNLKGLYDFIWKDYEYYDWGVF